MDFNFTSLAVDYTSTYSTVLHNCSTMITTLSGEYAMSVINQIRVLNSLFGLESNIA